MAFAQVQTATQGSGLGALVDVTVSPTVANNLVVACMKIGANSQTCSSVTDDKGNVYVLSSALDSGTTDRLYMAYGVQTTGGTTTIHFNFVGTGIGKRCGADEFSGGAVTNAAVFDTSSTGTGSTGTSLAVSSFSPSAAGNLIVGAVATTANKTFTAGTNYTLYSGVDPITLRSEYRLVSGTSETSPITSDTNAVWAEMAMSFKPLPAITATGGQRLPLLGVG